MKFYLRSLLRWSGESLDPSCGCFPSSRICDWKCSGQNPHIGSPTCGVRALLVGQVKRKPLELPRPRLRTNHKPHRVPGGITEISTSTEDLEGCCGGVSNSITAPFNVSIWCVQKMLGERHRSSRDHCLCCADVVPWLD